MKRLFTFVGISFGLIQVATAAYEQPLLARVTVYWKGEGSGERASWTGGHLHDGHVAVDPKRIPFGSKVIFDDAACVAVDTGTDVVNRKAARECGRNTAERNAIVIDRYFESKGAAMAWVDRHPHFVKVWVVPPGSIKRSDRNHVALDMNLSKNVGDQFSLTKRGKRG